MNVVVFALRGCPVAALGPYGNEWIATPNLDRLAAEGVVFDRHISDCPDPAAARRAWRSGRHQIPPLEAGSAGSDPAPSDLLELLRTVGIRTVLVRNTRETNDAPSSFYAGWDDLFDARPDPADPSPFDALERALPAILDRLAASERWLLWIECDRLLPPWTVKQDVFDVYVEDLIEGAEEADEETEEAEEPDEEEVEEPEEAPEPVQPWSDPPAGWFDTHDLASWELLHRSFAAVVTVFDAELGRVFDLFRARGLDRSAAWVLTADHGLPLGEHGVIGLFRPWLHEELVHVPLIVRLPEGVQAGRRVAALTQPADLMPTLAGWLGATVPAGEGIDLAPLLDGRAERVREFVVSGLDLGPAAEWAIRTPDWAYLLPARPHPDDDPREPMLFEKPADRWEVNDLRPRNLETAEDLEQRLRPASGGHQPPDGNRDGAGGG